MTGAEAWQKGEMKRTNPYPIGSQAYLAWNEDYDNAPANHYAKDLERFGAACHRARADQMDAEASFQGDIF